ncbi:MAG: ArnT family glycosyltransferase [Armatimonadota bacterium]
MYENKPPGVFLTWALVWALADGSPVAGRLVGVLATCASGFLMGGLAQRVWGTKVGVLAGALFVAAVCYWEYEFPFADTETFGILLSLGALYVAWPRPERRTGPLCAALGGFLCGLALLWKQIFVIELLVVMAVVALQPVGFLRRVSLAAAALGAAVVPLLACLAYFHWHGLLPEFLDCTVAFLGQAGTLAEAGLVTRLAESGVRLCLVFIGPMVLVLSVLGLCSIANLWRSPQRRVIIICLVWTGAALLAILVLGRASRHQFRQAVPALCLLAAGALGTHGRSRRTGLSADAGSPTIAGCLVAFGMGISLVASALQIRGEVGRAFEAQMQEPVTATRQEYASPEEAVRALTWPTDRIWCYPGGQVYANARRLSASPYHTPALLGRPGAQEQVLRALREGRAKLVVIDWVKVRDGRISRGFGRAHWPTFHRALSEVLQEHFVLRATAGDSGIYEFTGGVTP